MIAKILLTLGIIAAVVLISGMLSRSRQKRDSAPVQTLERCPSCGTYKPAGRPCDCG